MLKFPHNCTTDSRGNPNAAQFQDKKLGKGMRYWTPGKDGKRYCTVCGTKVG